MDVTVDGEGYVYVASDLGGLSICILASRNRDVTEWLFGIQFWLSTSGTFR